MSKSKLLDDHDAGIANKIKREDLMKKEKFKVGFTPVKEEPKLNTAEFLDKLTWRDISIGGRTGHETSMRYWAIKQYGTEEVAAMTDSDIKKRLLAEGFIPVSLNGGNDDDGVFLIHKDILRRAPLFTR